MTDKEIKMKKIKIKKPDIKGHFKNIKNDLIVDKLNALEWIALGVILLLIYLSLFYTDNVAMYLMYFWANQGLFDGSSVIWLGNNQLAYGMVQQIFCELWTLPINVIYTIHFIDITNTAVLLWYKLSMPFVFTLCMSEMIKIGKLLEISDKRIKWMLIIFASSILVALPVFHIAQSDVLYTYMLLLALKSLLYKDKKCFLIFAAMAVSCKLIAVIAIIPVLLLFEKRIFNVMIDALMVIMVHPVENTWYKIVGALDKLLFGLNSTTAQTEVVVKEVANNVADASTSIVDATVATTDATAVVAETVTVVQDRSDVMNDFFAHFYNKALFFEIPAIRKGYVASVMVVLLALLCVWCYVQKKEDTLEWKKKCVYVLATAWIIFFIMASPSPYWIVVMYPFLILMLFVNADRLRVNMLLHSAFTLLMFLVYVVNTYWVYGGSSNLDYLLFKGLLPEGHDSSLDGPYVARYLYNLGIENYMNIVTAVCLAAAIGLVVVNHGRIKINEELSEKDEHKLLHGFAIFQIVTLYIWYLMCVYAVTRW